MQYRFVIPPVDSFVSGGNWYNTYFTEALGRIADVETSCLANWRPNSNDEAIVIIDSIYLSKLDPNEIRLRKNRVLLLHYLDIFFDRKDDQDVVTKRLEQLSCFDYFLVSGRYVQDWLLAQGIRKESIFLFEPIISTTGFKSSASFNSPLKVLMLGNLLSVKGYLECLIELKLQQPSAIKVEIVGDASIDPAYASRMYQLIASSEYLSTTVVCRDAVPHDQVFDLFEKCDLLLSASQFETFGIAIHEALAFGLPVAALPAGNVSCIQHPNLFKYDTMPELVFSLQEQNRGRLTGLSVGNEIRKPSASWQDFATLFHTHFTGLIQ
jgi:glycosyltransferase involved in cell wall biosynthesis